MNHPLSVLALGFLLGMRHATDADHVVAVSALVARDRRPGAAWLLGAVWGLGHTATLFALGVAIILFKVVIPPRAGLGMEFAVGLMLLALGALNLSGRFGPL
ncbi:MAG: high-affinity nickel-transport family protein, partial [Elusimicrobia bacterium]|nr:high-affinity nickel-transport family protein [Elusimicrobiota bacterium]